MIELRWIWRIQDPITGRGQLVLQYRFKQYFCDSSGALIALGADWSEWHDVPTVRE